MPNSYTHLSKPVKKGTQHCPYPDGIVNLLDFSVFADCWRKDDPLADIAPDGGDDMVDFMDIAKLCEEWLHTEEWYQP